MTIISSNKSITPIGCFFNKIDTHDGVSYLTAELPNLKENESAITFIKSLKNKNVTIRNKKYNIKDCYLCGYKFKFVCSEQGSN